MKTNEFKKQEISEVFDKQLSDAPVYAGWDCLKVENCHTNGLSTYYTYLHRSKALKVVVRESDHCARHEAEQQGWTDGEIVLPAVIHTCGFGVFEALKWMEGKSDEYLIDKFCK